MEKSALLASPFVRPKKKVTLLLVGGGHGHVYVLKQLQRNRWPDAEVLLLSPSRYQYYSGMFSGYVEGLYDLEQICIDLSGMASSANVTWVEGSAVSIDPERQIVVTDRGETLGYDFVSFDIGSLTAGTEIPGVSQYAHVIKPNYMLPEILNRLRMEQEIVFVGGGPAGIELSLALQARREKEGIPASITLVSSSRLLHDYGDIVSDKIEQIVLRKGIQLFANHTVGKVEQHYLVTTLHEKISFDFLVWLAGPQAPNLFREAGLAVDNRGYLLVTATLQAKHYPNIFGVGDCVALEGHPHVAKAGVYAVREAPVLWRNLISSIKGGIPSTYRPQTDFLSLLSIGNEEGFLLYKGIALRGKWVWRLKKRIDTSFMNRYQI
jgi:NADH dehydrogenase FAD-containing subunit